MPTFVDEVETDLKWREEELSALKILVSQSTLNSPRQRALLRALTAMLYAHYEGFCKYCWDLYVEAISKQRVPKKSLVKSVKAAALEAEISKLKNSMSGEEVVDFLDHYEKLCRASVPLSIAVDTQSNLWPHRFEFIMNRLNLSCGLIVTYNTEIKALVGRRNGIAHGEKLIIADLASYEKFEHCAFLIMHELAFVIDEAISKESYKVKRRKTKAVAPASSITSP